jgi:hypothetical protein
MMEAARTSETSVDIQLWTWQYIPEDSELHTRRRENLKSHKMEFWMYIPKFWFIPSYMYESINLIVIVLAIYM